jgi:hypothetical protein
MITAHNAIRFVILSGIPTLLILQNSATIADRHDDLLADLSISGQTGPS